MGDCPLILNVLSEFVKGKSGGFRAAGRGGAEAAAPDGLLLQFQSAAGVALSFRADFPGDFPPPLDKTGNSP